MRRPRSAGAGVRLWGAWAAQLREYTRRTYRLTRGIDGDGASFLMILLCTTRHRDRQAAGWPARQDHFSSVTGGLERPRVAAVSGPLRAHELRLPCSALTRCLLCSLAANLLIRNPKPAASPQVSGCGSPQGARQHGSQMPPYFRRSARGWTLGCLDGLCDRLRAV